MVDLLWALALPVVLVVIMLWVIGAIFSMIGGGLRPGGGGGSGGFSLIAVGMIVSGFFRAAGAIGAAVLSGLVFPLFQAIGSAGGAAWRSIVMASARSGARAGGDSDPGVRGKRPTIFERRWWWVMPEDDHFSKWDREHYEQGEDKS